MVTKMEVSKQFLTHACSMIKGYSKMTVVLMANSNHCFLIRRLELPFSLCCAVIPADGHAESWLSWVES